MSKNFLPRHDNTNAHILSDGAQTNEKVGIPLKFLLVGHSLSLILTSEVDAETAPVSCQLVTPLMLATVYDPVCMVELSGSDAKMEVSCFNMAVSYSLEQTSLCMFISPIPPYQGQSLLFFFFYIHTPGFSMENCGRLHTGIKQH